MTTLSLSVKEREKETCEIDQENMKLSNIEELYQPSDDGTIQSYGTVRLKFLFSIFSISYLLFFNLFTVGCGSLYFHFNCGWNVGYSFNNSLSSQPSYLW